ncbi:MAG TPA: GNAT family N-acetyltransferase [Armatimonadota bacterium]|jgi:GNAT superfamily N-acetyltransferase
MVGVEVRAMRREEREQVLRLWVTVFGAGDSYFRAYFEGDPWHQDRFTRVAELDGELVAAVHAVDRRVRLGNGALRLAGVSNVATLPQHRRRGFSSLLLQDLAEICRQDGFDIGLLYTGKNAHYARHGWETLSVPYAQLTPPYPPALPANTLQAEWAPALEALPRLRAIYDRCATPLSVLRNGAYWSGWITTRIRDTSPPLRALILASSGGDVGYALLKEADEVPGKDQVWELCLAQGRGDAFSSMLQALVTDSRGRGVGGLQGDFPLGPRESEVMGRLGEPRVAESTSAMVLRLAADQSCYKEVVRLLESGEGRYWSLDHF